MDRPAFLLGFRAILRGLSWLFAGYWRGVCVDLRWMAFAPYCEEVRMPKMERRSFFGLVLAALPLPLLGQSTKT
jgi:hypothetical protein